MTNPSDAIASPPWLAGVSPETVMLARAAIGDIGDLPALRTNVLRLVQATEDPDVSMSEIVATIEADESLAANLLRYANSPAMSRPILAGSVRQATTMVGLRLVRQLALEAATYGFLERLPGGPAAGRGAMHLHAVAVASASSAIAERASVHADMAHLAGLLHDLGKLALPLLPGDRSGVAVAGVAQERQAYGIDHAQLGGLLGAAWGLPSEVVAAIAWHHGGPRELAGPDGVSACVQLANAMVGMLAGQAVDEGFLLGAADELGLDLHDLDALSEQAARIASKPPPDSLASRVSELEHRADTDELTGLLNRRAWFRRTREVLSAGEAGGVLFLDLDSFKQVNDIAGHDVGDLVLSQVASVFSRHGRSGRLGGDEFCVWVPGDLDGVRATAAAIIAETRDVLAAVCLPAAGLGVSVGIAMARPGEELEHLLARADRAVYAAKGDGRGRFVVAD